MQNIYLGALQIHSNSVDLGYAVEIPVNGLEFPGVRFSKYDKPGEDGAVVSSQFLSGRPITINGRVSGTTIAQYELNRRSLSYILSVIRNSLAVAQPLLMKFQTMDGLLLQSNVFVSNPPQVLTKSLNHAAFHIELFAPDPNLYDQSLQIATVGVPSGGGVVYPVIYPVTYAAQTGGSQTVTNSGDATTLPVITFNGPLTSPFINNLTAGIVFQANITLGPTDVLVVDMANKTMVLNGITNALQYFVSTNTWMYLLPGSNLIKLGTSLSSDTGNVQIAFRSAYIGA